MKRLPTSWLSAYELAVTVLLVYGGLQILHTVARYLGRFSVAVPPAIQDLDAGLYRQINGLSSAWGVGPILTSLEDPAILYSVPIASCLLYVWRRRRQELPLAIAGLVAAFIVGAQTIPSVQLYGVRPRPFVEIPEAIVEPYAREIWLLFPTFPSGHMRELTGLALVTIYFWRRSAWGLVPFMAFIAFGRVLLGAHFPSDVVAGIVLGLLSGGIAVLCVWRARILLELGEGSRSAVAAYSFMLGRTATGADLPTGLRLIRLAMTLAVLLGGVIALGWLLHVQILFGESILYDYLRSVDNTLALRLQPHFQPGLAAPLYAAFLAPYVTYPVTLALVLLSAWWHRRRLGVRIPIALIVSLALAWLLTVFVAPHFQRPFPPELLGWAQEGWPITWEGGGLPAASYPYPHAVVLAILATLLSRVSARAGMGLFVYALAASVAVLYLGAAWVTQVVPSILVGYLVGRYGLLAGDSVYSNYSANA